jgi:chemotaxis methyl-accepting protein methylase
MIEPVMIRVYDGAQKGATAFFRNRPLLDLLVAELRERCGENPRVFVHACSVGAEPYSLALWCLHRAGTPMAPAITATDLNPSFLAAARAGVYPESVLQGMTEEERGWFETGSPGEVQVPEAARRRVEFLPPHSFLEPLEARYDAVLILNALTYVQPGEQSSAIRQAGRAARHLMALTAFHPDSIRADVEATGFEPVLRNQRLIHEAWGDRLVPHPVPPDRPEYSWMLPPFETPAPDPEFRFCAVFARPDPAGTQGDTER